MKKTTAGRTLRNYDNRELTDNETLILYFKNEADAENLKNPDSIVSFLIGNTLVTAVLTAFPKGEIAEMARSQFYSYINDLNGKFHSAKTGSTDELKEKYDLEHGSHSNDPGYTYEIIDNTIKIIDRLTNEAPQLMAAVIFHREDKKGKDFEEAMRISHDRSAEIQNKLTHILNVMMTKGYDAVKLNVRATKNDPYYRQVILEHLNEVLDDLMELYHAL